MKNKKFVINQEITGAELAKRLLAFLDSRKFSDDYSITICNELAKHNNQDIYDWRYNISLKKFREMLIDVKDT